MEWATALIFIPLRAAGTFDMLAACHCVVPSVLESNTSKDDHDHVEGRCIYISISMYMYMFVGCFAFCWL